LQMTALIPPVQPGNLKPNIRIMPDIGHLGAPGTIHHRSGYVFSLSLLLLSPVLMMDSCVIITYKDECMNRILILFAHPRYEKSRINRALLEGLHGSDGITIHDLYELYPDFNIDVHRERDLLLEHDIVVWQHPLYMYSAPAMTKQWMDMVLEFGWAHGAGVDNLTGKVAFNAVTAGGTRESYGRDGFNRYTLQEFLYPFEQTARLCRMIYLPPFAVQGTYRMGHEELSWYAALYRGMLEYLCLHAPGEDMQHHPYLNDWYLERHGRKTP